MAAAVLVLFAIAAIYLVTALQKFLTFPGAHPSVQRLAARDEAGGESIWLDIDGERVEAWFLPATGALPHPLLIHAHGNGELIDIQTKSVAPLRAAGISVLLVEYPGYGRSGGNPSEKSVTATFVAAYDRVKGDPRVDATRIIGYGRSLGGGAVAQLAARRPLAALVLESTFTSIAADGAGRRRAGLAGGQSISTRARCSRNIPGRCSSCTAPAIRPFPWRMATRCVRLRPMPNCTSKSAVTTIVRRSGSWYSVSSGGTAY